VPPQASLQALHAAIETRTAGSAHYHMWDTLMVHVTTALMLPRAAREDDAAMLKAAYIRALDLNCIRGRHKYMNLIMRMIRTCHVLSEQERAWWERNVAVAVKETGGKLLKDEAVEMHVVQKLKQALKTTDVESALRTGNRLEAVMGNLSTLLHEVHGEERLAVERGASLARKLQRNDALAVLFHSKMAAKLLPVFRAEAALQASDPPVVAATLSIGANATVGLSLRPLQQASALPLQNLIGEHPIPLNHKAGEFRSYLERTLADRRARVAGRALHPDLGFGYVADNPVCVFKLNCDIPPPVKLQPVGADVGGKGSGAKGAKGAKRAKATKVRKGAHASAEALPPSALAKLVPYPFSTEVKEALLGLYNHGKSSAVPSVLRWGRVVDRKGVRLITVRHGEGSAFDAFSGCRTNILETRRGAAIRSYTVPWVGYDGMAVLRLVPANAGVAPGAKKTGKAVAAGALAWVGRRQYAGGFTEVAIFCEAGENPYKWPEELVRFTNNVLPKLKNAEVARIASSHAPVRTYDFSFGELRAGTPAVSKLISLKGGERTDVIAAFSTLLTEKDAAGKLAHADALQLIPSGCRMTLHGVDSDDPFVSLSTARTAAGCATTRAAPTAWLEGEDGLIGTACIRAKQGLHSLVMIDDTDAVSLLTLGMARVIYTDGGTSGRVFWSKLSDRDDPSRYVDVNDMVEGIVSSEPLQQWIDTGDASHAAQVRRAASFVAAILLAGGDTTSKLQGTSVEKVVDWYMEYIEFIGPLVSPVPNDDGLPIFAVDEAAHLRYWSVMGTLRAKPFSVAAKLDFRVTSSMADRIRALSAPGYLAKMRDLLLNDPQRRVDLTGGNSLLQVPSVGDLACERQRANARLYQWGTVTKPDPQFGARTEGLQPIDPARGLGRWNAQPTWAPRSAAPNAAAAAAAPAPPVLVALAELQRLHGEALAQLEREELRDQLRARGLGDEELRAAGGRYKQAGTLRKMLLARGDRVAMAVDDGAPAGGVAVAGGAAAAAARAPGDVAAGVGATGAGAPDAAVPRNRQLPGWVQCSRCQQRRRVADPLALPDDWACAQNADVLYSSCSTPQEELQPGEELPWEEEDDDDYEASDDGDSASDDSDEGESESEGDADANGAGAGDGAEMGATGELPAPADAMAEDDEEPPCPICHRYGASWRHWLCCDGTVNGKACAVWVHATCVNRKTKAQRAAVWLCEACDV
jgi:hypothetical protein